MKNVTLKTEDGFEISADVYEAPAEKQFAILLHMMPATKESWQPFATELMDQGYTCIAIDERGHGESTMNGTVLYKEFSDEEQQAKIHDVRAAFEHLKTLGASEENMVVVGASIGANLAVQFLSENPGIKKAVALSPGTNYRGVWAGEFVKELHPGQRLLLVASQEDEFSFQSIQEMHASNSDQTEVIKENGLGHGTTMFENKKELMAQVISWLK